MTNSKLAELIEVHGSLPRAQLPAIVCALLSPFLILLAWDYGNRVVTDADKTLSGPWETAPPLHPANSTIIDERGWGDLLRKAGLPAYDRRFEGLDRTRIIAADGEGFRQVPGVDRHGADVLIAGASFFGAGTNNRDIFAARLGPHVPGAVIADVSLPGLGPVAAVLRALTEDSITEAPPKLLIWGIVQRGLQANMFNPIARQIDSDGNLTGRSGTKAKLQTAIRYLRWNTSMENYLTATSVVRKEATVLNPYLLPMLVDEGRTSSVYLAQLDLKGGPRPMLFLNESVKSSNTPLAARDQGRLLNGFERINARCQRLGIQLLVLVVPDKYEMYRYAAHFVSQPTGRYETRGGTRAAQSLAEELTRRGIPCVDLFPILHKIQREAPDTLLFRTADTHWNDLGIQVAAEGVASTVRALLDD